MTDEHSGMPEPPEPPPSPQPAGSSGENPVQAMFSTGEGMVAVAGILLLVVWLIFEIITEDYGVPTLGLVLATIAVIAPRMPEQVEKMGSLARIMKTVGYLLAIVGVFEIVEDIRFADVLLDEAGEIIAALGAYAAYALAFLGARKIET